MVSVVVDMFDMLFDVFDVDSDVGDGAVEASFSKLSDDGFFRAFKLFNGTLPYNSSLIQKDDAINASPDGAMLVGDHDIATDATALLKRNLSPLFSPHVARIVHGSNEIFNDCTRDWVQSGGGLVVHDTLFHVAFR